MSEVIFIMFIIITMLTIYCLYKTYDKRGLYFSLVTMSVISFIFSFKIVNIFTLNVNLNIIPMISIFTIIYLLVLKYGLKETKNILLLTSCINITTAILILITNYYIPAVTETISISMEGTFLYNYKILITYPIIMLVSEYLVIKTFNFIKTLSNNIYINIILIYIITGLLYTIIFYLISYINILKISNTIFLGVTTFLVGLLITVINLLIIKFISPKGVV